MYKYEVKACEVADFYLIIFYYYLPYKIQVFNDSFFSFLN